MKLGFGLAVGLLGMLALLSAVRKTEAQGGAVVETEISVGQFFRVDLEQELGLQNVVAVGALPGGPAPPEWMNINLLPIIFGMTPDDFSSPAFSVGVVQEDPNNGAHFVSTLNVLVDTTLGT